MKSFFYLVFKAVLTVSLLLSISIVVKAQPLVKSAIQVNPGNTKLTGETFGYRLTYHCGNTSGPCLNAEVIDLLPPEVQFVSTVPASPTDDIAAINVTPNFMGTGRTRVLFQLINPLPAGNSGDLIINVRFPNGTTPHGTAAVNTANGINLETAPGTFTTPPATVTGVYATPRPDPTVSLTLIPSPAYLDLPETYRLRFAVPNVNGSGNFTSAGPVTATLPPGTVFIGAAPAADCQPGCVGTTPATVTWTSPYSLPLTPGQNGDISINVTFPSATFPSGTNVTTTAVVQATRLGESSATYGPGSITHPVTTFVPTPGASISLNMAGNTPNPPTLNQSFSYDMNWGNNGNVPLDNTVVIVTLPMEMAVTSITTGAYSGLSDFAAGEGVRVSYEKNTALGVFTLWGSSPNTTTSTTLTAPPPGLGAGEYITRVRWEYGQAQTGMTATTRPLITGRIVNPDNAGGPVVIGDAIQACANLTAVYTAGPTNVNQNECENFTLSGPFVQLNPAKENLSGGGPFNIGQIVSFRLRVRSDARSSDPVPLESLIATDLLPAGFTFNPSWTFDDRGTGLPAPQVFDVIPNFANTGRTLLRWRWNAGSGNLGVNQDIWINISVTVNNSVVNGSLSNDFTLDSDAPGLAQRCSGSSQADLLDFDGDGNMGESLCRATVTVNISAPPRIVSNTLNDANPTNAPSVSWRVTFNEAVYGVTAANFNLAGIGDAAITNAVAENNTPNDDVWLITASTGTGSGSLGLNLTVSNNIRSVSADRGIEPNALPFTGDAYTIDKIPPTANLLAVSPAIGTTVYAFTVTYTDISGVNISTLDNADLRVTGPNGYDVTATLSNVDFNSNGSPRIATYSIPGPGGVWDGADAGLYSITWISNQVADVVGNTNVTGVLGGFTLCPVGSGITLFVNAAAAGGNGLSWATAFTTLQDALSFTNQCANVTQIWVAKGTYYPDEGPGQTDNARTSSFVMKNGVAIYGGFVGTEINLTDRMLNLISTTNETILSGDIDHTSDPDVVTGSGSTLNITGNGGNAIHVFSNSTGLTGTAILDGFTVSGGNANATSPHNSGGGMLNDGSGTGNFCSPTIQNCTFIHNSASSSGGAVANPGNDGNSSPVFINCTFSKNSASVGGGVIHAGNSTTRYENCNFNDNSAVAYGGGIGFVGLASFVASISFTDCTFTGNVSRTGQGGAIQNSVSGNNGTRTLTLTNCTFIDNRATFGSGAISNGNGGISGTTPMIFDKCFFKNNIAHNGGAFGTGGAYQSVGGSGQTAAFTNCLFDGNKAPGTGDDGGGAIMIYNGSITLINTTLVNNQSATKGGAISIYNNTGSAIIKNSILWNNTATSSNNIYNGGGGSASAQYSLLQEASCPANVTCGSGMIYNQDPLFVSSSDFGLQACSPAINAGTNAGAPTSDIVGTTRPLTVADPADMGAYESQATLTATPANVSIINSICGAGCIVGGGSISAPTGTPCPAGATLQYQVNSGMWSSILPTYDQTGPAQIIKTRCSCNADPTRFSPESSVVTTVPGTVPALNIPANGAATVSCPALAVQPPPPLVNDCGGSPIMPSGPVVNNIPNPLTCEGTRTYTYTYSCGSNISTWSFVYTIEREPFTIAAPNGSATVACLANATPPTLPTVNSNCGETLTPSTPVITDSPSSLTCEGTRTYAYTFTDCEGNTATWSFVYTIERLPFTITTPNGAATIACLANATPPTPPTVSSNCGETLTPSTPVITNSPSSLTCEGTRTYAYTFTDCEGNTATWSFVYTIERLPFTITTPNGAATVYNPVLATPPTLPTVLSHCGETLTPAAPVITNAPNLLLCEGTRTYAYTYTDCEGNTATWSFVYTVIDNIPPVITCPANLTVCEATMVTYTPPVGTDNCIGPVTIQIAGLPSGSLFPVGMTTNEFKVTATNGQSRTCSFTVTVNPLPTATISGTTQICQNAPFPNITFTAAGATAPYTFTYKINGGPTQTLTTNMANSVSISQTTAMAGNFSYNLISVKDASSTQCSQSQSASAIITVHAPPVVSTPQTALCTGLSMTLSPTSGGTWQSSNPSMASVNNAGLVTAIMPGVVSFTFTQTSTGCSAATANVTIKPTPTSALTASKYDVCPNTPVTLTPNCSIPTSSVNWNPGAPTVTPDAATLPYVYRARCVADGCVGNETSVEVRTHRILVDMKDLDVGALPLPIVRAVKDNMEPTNQINAPAFPRRWTFIATGCDASEAAVFKLSGPVNFNTIDNAATYAMFANDAGGFYSIDHPNYGNGGSFPNGTYTLTIDLRSRDGVGGPFPKNRVATGALLATRTLQFTVVGPSNGSVGSRQSAVGGEEWAVSSGQFAEVAPNPVSNTMRLKISEAKGQSVSVSLIDASGRTMLQRDFVPETNQHQEEFEVSNLAVGMYFLRVNAENKNANLKVIKVQ